MCLEKKTCYVVAVPLLVVDVTDVRFVLNAGAGSDFAFRILVPPLTQLAEYHLVVTVVLVRTNMSASALKAD
jgi:hypothetical protein